MRRFLSRATLLLLTIIFLARGGIAVACTTFCLDDGRTVVFGRNYDFEIGNGLVMVNKRNVAKFSLIGTPAQQALLDELRPDPADKGGGAVRKTGTPSQRTPTPDSQAGPKPGEPAASRPPAVGPAPAADRSHVVSRSPASDRAPADSSAPVDSSAPAGRRAPVDGRMANGAAGAGPGANGGDGPGANGAVAAVAVNAAVDQPARWTSKYGSVTFNQYGREFPTGGMNEKGLVVELMWLDETRYPPADARPALGVLEWIQYQLDNFASVGEVVRHIDEVRIHGEVPIHYLVADPTGATAAIEFLDGKPVIHQGWQLPVAALTNDTYERSLGYLQGRKGFGGNDPLPAGRGSLERFARVASMMKDSAVPVATPIVERAFEILANVAQGQGTRWSIVYDMTNLAVMFRTWNHAETRALRLASFDFSCSTPVRVLDVSAGLAGDVTNRFTDYTTKANLELVTGSYRSVSFLAKTPASVIEKVARHPEATSCMR